ncbi:MAG: NAD+ synthase [Pseudomonadota bacterium]|jgi:NAD+ synthase|nr:NAD+ synthase [Pseudomonadota bacterium]MED5423293.1 NAD+ synthase [Pseudomonadota bacterium]
MSADLNIAMIQFNATTGDLNGNAAKIKDAYKQAKNGQGSVLPDVIVSAEQSVTGYALDDLVFRKAFLDATRRTVESLAKITKDGPPLIVGAPWVIEDGTRQALINAALKLENGQISDVISKRALPTYGPFHEQRYYARGNDYAPININGRKVGIAICRDLWEDECINAFKANGAEAIISINASPYEAGKPQDRLGVARRAAALSGLPVAYVNTLGGQDELIFDGAGFVMNAAGDVTAAQKQWADDITHANMFAPPPAANVLPWREEELAQTYEAIVLATRDYAHKNGFKSAVIGMSGGIDSALTTAIACDALGPENVHCLMLAHDDYTSDNSLNFSRESAEMNGCHYSDDLKIKAPFEAMQAELSKRWDHTKVKETPENIQARLRMLFLFAVSNDEKHLVLNTSNKSEVALGHSTFYGDTSGGFAPIKDVWKLQVYELAKWRNNNKCRIGLGVDGVVVHPEIIAREPTPELGEDEIDLDLLPPYTVTDPILKALVEDEASVSDIVAMGFERETVCQLAYHMQKQEFKRAQTPPGPIVSKRSFAQRERLYPITNHYYPRRYE